MGGLGRRDAGGRERGRALGVGGWHLHWVLCLGRLRGSGGGGGAAGCAGCGGGGETLNASTRRSDGCGRGGAWRSPGFECGRNRFVCSTGGSSARTEAGGSPGPAPGVAGVFRSRARGPRARPRVNLHESQSEAESAQCGCPMRAAAPSPPSATRVSRLAGLGRLLAPPPPAVRICSLALASPPRATPPSGRFSTLPSTLPPIRLRSALRPSQTSPSREHRPPSRPTPAHLRPNSRPRRPLHRAPAPFPGHLSLNQSRPLLPPQLVTSAAPSSASGPARVATPHTHPRHPRILAGLSPAGARSRPCPSSWGVRFHYDSLRGPNSTVLTSNLISSAFASPSSAARATAHPAQKPPPPPPPHVNALPHHPPPGARPSGQKLQPGGTVCVRPRAWGHPSSPHDRDPLVPGAPTATRASPSPPSLPSEPSMVITRLGLYTPTTPPALVRPRARLRPTPSSTALSPPRGSRVRHPRLQGRILPRVRGRRHPRPVPARARLSRKGRFASWASASTVV